MVSFLKSFIFVLVSVIMSIVLNIIPQTSGPISVTYASVLSIYLGVDLADTIIKTAQMSKGQYKDMHIHKYVISLICLAALVINCVIIKNKCDVSTALTSFVSSIFIVAGILIGGLEGNKIATNIDGDNKNE